MKQATDESGTEEQQMNTDMSGDKIEEIRRMYFGTTPKTIERDLDRAIDILKSLKTDDERSKAAVFMDGLNELRKEWKKGRR
jgi:hypothetical protein